MADTGQLRQTVATYNENGALYAVLGLLTGLAAWEVPILSLVAIACGRGLLSGDSHRLLGAFVLGLGGLALLRLLWMMAVPL